MLTGSKFLPVLVSQGHGRAGRPGLSAAGALLRVWGPVVAGCSSVGLGPAGLGGTEDGHVVETGPYAESCPHQGHPAPDSGSQRQDPDGVVPKSPASGAGD